MSTIREAFAKLNVKLSLTEQFLTEVPPEEEKEFLDECFVYNQQVASDVKENPHDYEYGPPQAEQHKLVLAQHVLSVEKAIKDIPLIAVDEQRTARTSLHNALHWPVIRNSCIGLLFEFKRNGYDDIVERAVQNFTGLSTVMESTRLKELIGFLEFFCAMYDGKLSEAKLQLDGQVSYPLVDEDLVSVMGSYNREMYLQYAIWCLVARKFKKAQLRRQKKILIQVSKRHTVHVFGDRIVSLWNKYADKRDKHGISQLTITPDGGKMVIKSAYINEWRKDLEYIYGMVNGEETLADFGRIDLIELIKNISRRKQCDNCWKRDVQLRACGRCKCAVYCGIYCQFAHWPQHKAVCEEYANSRLRYRRNQLRFNL